MPSTKLTHTKSELAFFEELLTPPKTFKREQWMSFLYAPYSRKCNRRVHCYGHATYNIWILLETDKAVVSFNAEPPKFPIVGIDNRIVQFQPSFVSQDLNGAITVHDFDASNHTLPNVTSNSNAEIRPGLSEWATQHGAEIKLWNATTFQARRQELENKKQILRYVSTPNYRSNIAIKEKVEGLLKQSRQETVGNLIAHIPGDESIILATIAELILDESCHSDIASRPFHFATLLSLYHDIEIV